MMCNIDQQVLLQECLDGTRSKYRNELQSGRSNSLLRNKNASMKFMRVDVLTKVTHLPNAYGRFVRELDPYGPNLGFWVRIFR